MTTRTPLETLTLARDYLDSLLADSTKGPWNISRSGDWIKRDFEFFGAQNEDVARAMEPTDAALIVALHATAPAIREQLNDAVLGVNVWGRDWQRTKDEGRIRSAWSLATAILSTPHAAQWITDREATQ